MFNVLNKNTTKSGSDRHQNRGVESFAERAWKTFPRNRTIDLLRHIRQIGS